MVVTLASTSDLVYTSALLAFSERVFTIADTASSFEESLSAISPRVSRAAGAVPITSLIRLSTSVLVAQSLSALVKSVPTVAFSLAISSSVQCLLSATP